MGDFIDCLACAGYQPVTELSNPTLIYCINATSAGGGSRINIQSSRSTTADMRAKKLLDTSWIYPLALPAPTQITEERRILRTVIDSFEVVSSNGSHLCLVFEPMREPLWLFRRRFGADKVTAPFLPVFKAYLRILLEGLDYLHSECHIIHTG